MLLLHVPQIREKPSFINIFPSTKTQNRPSHKSFMHDVSSFLDDDDTVWGHRGRPGGEGHGNHVDEEVEDVGGGDGCGDVLLLQRPPLPLHGDLVCPGRELLDEELARFGENQRRLARDQLPLLP
ncbi:hypothetical protein HPP92_005050 [Vanilla planifolia]|uniref:Uncharacterized protein n=1 Tax=Vanilla planifolia TaxID=51239 RepID=A0A835RTB4_VANPL|nr:hypothetical protein HPP92_005050 [Vanilla planifolia]